MLDELRNTVTGATTSARRPVLRALAAAGAAGILPTAAGARSEPRQGAGAPPGRTFALEEATIADIHRAMKRRQLTARALTERYLDRIDAYDDSLNAILHVNEDALSRADALDETLSDGGLVGPLHGIPVILKDNYDTGDMPTTAGSKTLADVVPPDDATLVRKLRDAGGIMIAKANMHEFAYGWETFSSLGGQTRNAYDTERIPGGSSGGSAAAVAANLATLSTGSDTCGSVRVPPAFNNAVGVRGTIGLTSRDGIVPMSKTQDIGGPITRTVADAAIMLDVMVGYDPVDPSTALSVGEIPVAGDPPITTWPPGRGRSTGGPGGPASYTDFLDPDGLDGARLGVVREYLEETGDRAEVTAIVEAAIDDMRDEGASVVDVDVPDVNIDSAALFAISVIGLEFEREMNAYLASLDDPDAPADLTEIVNSPPGDVHPDVRNTLQGDEAVDVSALDENAAYLYSLVRRADFDVVDDPDTTPGLRRAILMAMADRDLDALLYPTVSAPPVAIPETGIPQQPFDSVNCMLSAGSGLPAVTVPGGFTASDDLPVGLEFLGRPFDEGTLLRLAYAYEQATGHRRPPEGFGPLSG